MKHQSIAFSIHDRDGDTAASGKEDNEFAWDGMFVFASEPEIRMTMLLFWCEASAES